MSETCDACGQVISQASTVEELTAAIKKDWNWYSWSDAIVGTLRDVPNVGKVQLIDKSENVNEDPGYSTLDIHMVFYIERLNTYYRLDGELSSYEGHDWERTLKRVNKQKKEIYVYE